MFPWETLITGVVGLAGIGGTLWQGKRSREAQTADLKASLDAATDNLKLSISTEDRRNRRTEKRQIYAACLASINAVAPSFATSHAGDFIKPLSWVSINAMFTTTMDLLFGCTKRDRPTDS